MNILATVALGFVAVAATCLVTIGALTWWHDRREARAEAMRRHPSAQPFWCDVLGVLRPGFYTFAVLEELRDYPKERWQEVADALMDAETNLDRELETLR